MGMTQSLDFETGVIGALLIDPEHVIGDMMLEISAEDFSIPSYREIFEAVRTLWQQGKTVDALTVAEAVGPDYKQVIMDAMTITPTAANWRTYADGMKAATMGHKMDALAQQILDAHNPADKLTAVEQMQQIQIRRSSIREVEWIDGLRQMYMRQAEGRRPNYLSWGFQKLDRDLYIRPGSFVILAGFASAGKTALATQFALHFARTGRRVGFYSFETDDETLFDRMTAQVAGANFGRIKSYSMTAEDCDAIVAAGTSTKNMTLTYIGASGWDVAQIQAHATARKYDVILIDYVQLISGKGETRAEEVARISMALHTMAQRTGITVIGLSQLTPTGQNTPGMNDLRESRQLTQDADAIMILRIAQDTDGNETDNDRVLHVVKNKEGRLIQFLLQLNPATMLFETVEEQGPDYDEPETNSRGFRKAVAPPKREVQL